MRVNGAIRGKGLRGMDTGERISPNIGNGRWNRVIYEMVPNEMWGWCRGIFLEEEMKKMLEKFVVEPGTLFWRGNKLMQVQVRLGKKGREYILVEVEKSALLRDITRQGKAI